MNVFTGARFHGKTQRVFVKLQQHYSELAVKTIFSNLKHSAVLTVTLDNNITLIHNPTIHRSYCVLLSLPVLLLPRPRDAVAHLKDKFS